MLGTGGSGIQWKNAIWNLAAINDGRVKFNIKGNLITSFLDNKPR